MRTIIQRMNDAGVRLIPDGFKLQLDYPTDTDPTLLAEIREHRDAIVELYNERAAIREFDAGYPRDEAERLAVQDLMEIGERWRATA